MGVWSVLLALEVDEDGGTDDRDEVERKEHEVADDVRGREFVPRCLYLPPRLLEEVAVSDKGSASGHEITGAGFNECLHMTLAYSLTDMLITLDAYLVKCVIKALLKHGLSNSTGDSSALRKHEEVNINERQRPVENAKDEALGDISEEEHQDRDDEGHGDRRAEAQPHRPPEIGVHDEVEPSLSGTTHQQSSSSFRWHEEGKDRP